MKFLDLTTQYKSIKKEIDEAIQRVLDSGVFIGGAEVLDFEKEVADFCQAKYAVGVNSGTDALFLSLKALDIEKGDEIITTPFSFIASADVIAHLGAKPVFIDIDPATFNIDPAKIEKAIDEKTKAIIPVHLFGQTAEMTEIARIAQKHNLKIIEDAAQAIGATYQNKKAGTMGEAGCFSFFPVKNLGAYGDGGMVITNNEKVADAVRLLRTHGSSPEAKYTNLFLGYKSRLDALQAAILRVKLKHLSEWNEKRIEKAAYYNEKLKGVGDIKTPFIGSERTHIFHQYAIRTKKRNELQKYLKEKNIPTMIYYPLPLHLQPAFKYLDYKEGDFPEAEKASREILSLPVYPELSLGDQNQIIKAISGFYNVQNS